MLKNVIIALTLLAAAPATAQAVDPAEEFPEATDALVSATAAFFDAVEARDRRTPRIVVGTPAVPAATAPEAPDDHALAKPPAPLSGLTGYRVTWYPMDDLIGAVDFVGTWDGGRNLVCGYLMWDVSDPDAISLRDVVATYVETEGLGGRDATAAALVEANCAFDDTAGNFALALN